MLVEAKVKPGSRQDRVTETKNDAGHLVLVAELKSPAHEGKANTALIKLLARHFGVPRAAVTIKRGLRSRNKLVEVTSGQANAL